MNTGHILHSGDLELIVQHCGKETILHHFGEESFEYLAYEQSLADKIWKKQQPKKYITPRRTEDPAVTKGMASSWIRDFCKMNGMKLSKGYYGRNKNQLLGMYYGMLRYYRIKPSDIVPQY